MTFPAHDELEKLVSQVMDSGKYADISPDLVRSIGQSELGKRQSLKDAVKATRSKLHQVGSAYQESSIPYARWKKDLSSLSHSLDDAAVQTWLRSSMRMHASTRERLPILERIYAETLASLGSAESVLDVACGLNPLSIPWMPLKDGFTYQAVDIFSNMTDFLNLYFDHFVIQGRAETADVLQNPPLQPVQLALIMKTIPCLEQLDKQAGIRLLDTIRAETLLVSFPAKSLGGRSKGMVQNYEAHFRELTAGRSWKIERFEFPGELVFRVQK